ncbi:MAG TPA: hypothetical protein VNS88_14915, partial [Nitrospiraceae bacterium]|nr:hypothetical protein [Nitrospiraceae bacterium]
RLPKSHHFGSLKNGKQGRPWAMNRIGGRDVRGKKRDVVNLKIQYIGRYVRFHHANHVSLLRHLHQWIGGEQLLQSFLRPSRLVQNPKRWQIGGNPSVEATT